MGKSATGKDTIFKLLTESVNVKLKTIVPYTTRPIRDGEVEGREYFYVDENRLEAFQREGKIIELRAYDTIHGVWKYFTVDDKQIELDCNDYLIIGTLESYQKTSTYFGKEKVVPILITVDDGVRLQRALDRERVQANPKYEELCRRFLADAKDFSIAKMRDAGITKTFENRDLKQCLNEIEQFILSEKL